MENSAPNLGRWPARTLAALFFAVLLLSLLDQCFHIDPTAPPSENRLLAEFPPMSGGFGGVKKFLAAWEIYYNDHFGGRKVLVMWHNKLKWSLFKDKAARNTLVGADGWMYFSAAQMVEHFRGALQFTAPELDAWQRLLEHRRDWLAKHGIKYIFVLAPDKQSIYPENLPAWLRPLAGRTKADQFIDHMRAHSTVEVLDLRPVMLAAKKSAPVYQKTDTHWNEFGAFIAAQEVTSALAKNQLPELAPLSLEDFDCTNRLAAGGDLARSLGVSLAESNAFFLTPRPALPALKVFIPSGIHIKEMATAANPQGRGRAMIYHDSFGRYWVPFLGYPFGEADFFWEYLFDARRIEQERPAVVVNEMLERFFNVTDPNELSALDALP